MDWQYYAFAVMWGVIAYVEGADIPGWSPLSQLVGHLVVAFLFTWLFYRLVCRYEAWASADDDFAAELSG